MIFGLAYKRIRKILSRSNGEVLQELYRMNVLARDQGLFLGSAWNVAHPLVMLLVMYLVFHDTFGGGIKFYPLYLYIGIIIVNFFIQATSQSLGVLRSSRDLLLNTALSRETFLLAHFLGRAYLFLIELLLGVIFAGALGCFKWTEILLLVPLSLAFFLFSFGCVLVLSILHCLARDTAQIWSLVTKALFFVTPVFYSLRQMDSSSVKLLFMGNPLSCFVLSFQDIFLGTALLPINYYSCYLWGVISFVVGYGLFLRLESQALEMI